MKQTESLLKNGHITSRGKAYASGTAYNGGSVHPWLGGMGNIDDDWQNITPTIWNTATNGEYLKDETNALSDSLSDAADSVNEFEESIDWIEIRMEEFDERIGKLSAELENLTTYTAKNAHLDKIINENQKKYADSLAGAKYYEQYAQKYLEGMNSTLVKAAKNGSIAITEFTKEQDEATVKAIQNYRDYAQKSADLYQQAEEILTDIRNSVIQKIDNIQSYGEAKTGIEDLQTDKLQNAVDYWDTKGEIPASAYYGMNGGNAKNSTGMFENSYKKIEYWIPVLNDMQLAFDKAVQDGLIAIGSIEWYEQLEKLYKVQAEIDAATMEIEEFQNAINDIYWDNFDELTNRLDYVKNDTQSLIDLMSHDDMIAEPQKKTYKGGTEEYWTADDVDFTDEGIATLGLYAQQMELAEYTTKEYAKAIDDLTADYEAGKYSESEYLEKLNELKDGQYESIEAYYDAKDAIIDLNKTRVESIKEGIEAEIKAYEELIKKKQEELDVEQDLYSFQKNVAKQQKDIADIQRKIAALSGDNSASAIAKRKQLEAELYEAQDALEETYYDRSIQNQQDALDKDLEYFQEEKDAEIKKWDEYLENVEQLVTDSLNIVQANATEIGNTLTEKTQEYNLTVSDAVLTPWKDGALAVDEYTTKFGDSISSTTDQLTLLKNAWQEVIDKMVEAAKIEISTQAKENDSYAAATKKEPAKTTTTTTTNKSTTQTKTAPKVGGTVKVKTSATHFSANSGNVRMASFVPGGSYTVYETDGNQVLIGKNGVYTGWVKQSDLQYAKGTLGVKEDQIALIDELGEELVMHAGPDGRLQYLSKGSSVIPHDITENLMQIGQLNPSEVLDRNRPAITAPHVTNTEIHIDNSIGELIHIDKCDQSTLPDVQKIVNKALDKHMQNLNNSLRRYTRG